MKTRITLILATLTTIALMANDPPPEGAPLVSETNPRAKVVPTRTNHVDSVKPVTNTVDTPRIPVYVVPKYTLVQTPLGMVTLIPERNWEDLKILFPHIEMTNFVIYNK